MKFVRRAVAGIAAGARIECTTEGACVLAPPSPADADFAAWTTMMAEAIRTTYDEAPALRPMNLAGGVLPGGVSRPDGYPTADDVAAAYGVFRLVMRIGTEEKIAEPQPRPRSCSRCGRASSAATARRRR